METLKRYCWNQRAAFAVMLLLVFASLSTGPLGPAKAYAVPCCGWRLVTTYYSDASHTTIVGRCIDSDCTGFSCTGEQTEFSSTTVSCCERCTF
jgi:hypothetical protein